MWDRDYVDKQNRSGDAKTKKLLTYRMTNTLTLQKL